VIVLTILEQFFPLSFMLHLDLPWNLNAVTEIRDNFGYCGAIRKRLEKRGILHSDLLNCNVDFYESNWGL
jgi:hypothetical protein